MPCSELPGSRYLTQTLLITVLGKIPLGESPRKCLLGGSYYSRFHLAVFGVAKLAVKASWKRSEGGTRSQVCLRSTREELSQYNPSELGVHLALQWLSQAFNQAESPERLKDSGTRKQAREKATIVDGTFRGNFAVKSHAFVRKSHEGSLLSVSI